jgi:outer membrane PBP1 activator LpoA protein
MGRFYAMGADTYQLATQLQLLQALPNTSTDGLTGRMQLDPQNRVERQTGWAHYVDGTLEVLP